MVYIWLAALVAFIVIEALTIQMLTVWFALGSLAAVIATLCGASTGVQIAVFLAVSVVALVATRPFVKRFTGLKYSPTNADRLIGEKAIVTADIDNLNETGAIKVKGSEWTARSANGDAIPKGQTVTVKEIEGVKLIVEIVTD